MRNHNITLEQRVTNRINQEVDFTQKISGLNRDGRYVVAVQAIFEGELPSHNPHMLSFVTDAIDNHKAYGADSIGGWKDKETGIYYVDMCHHFQFKSHAMQVAIKNEQIAIYDLFEDKEIRVEDYIKETLL